MTDSAQSPLVSVVLPTHNPRLDYLQRVLDALRGQTLLQDQWELLVVDSCCAEPLAGRLDLSWHPASRIVREEKAGLTSARLRGFAETRGALIVLVDDDNVLEADYLEQAVIISDRFPFLGAWSGQSIPEFEDPDCQPHPLLRGFLQERRLEGDCWSNDRHHTKSDPYGAGMCLRRPVAAAYRQRLEREPMRAGLDLQGSTLLYGGDLDLAFTGLDLGLGKGVFRRLSFVHLMPVSRCQIEYLLRAAAGHAESQTLAAWLNGDELPGSHETWQSRLLEWVRGIRHGAVYRARHQARKLGLARGRQTVLRLRATGGPQSPAADKATQTSQ